MSTRRLRIHEACHAVMALACELDFMFLSGLDQKEMLQLYPPTKAQLKDAEYCEKYAIVATAGAVGECRAFSDHFLDSLNHGLGSKDMANAAYVQPDLCSILRAAGKAADYLVANWDAVERLASALERCPILFRQNVKEIAGDLPLLFPSPKPEPAMQIESTAVYNKRMEFKRSMEALVRSHGDRMPFHEAWRLNESLMISPHF